MFDHISPKYDLLNHLLSFGLDIHWRKLLGKFLPNRTNIKVLDLATGTADVLLSLFKNNTNVLSGCGIDMANKMMDIGRKKIAKHNLDAQITLLHGDAHHIPLDNNSFDAVSIAFGIRNMTVPLGVLSEMHRVLNIGGRALVLEFSLPQNSIVRAFHLFYLRHFVPIIGALFSGHYAAYKYLNQTIESFPYGNDFCALMSEAGFKNISAHPLLFGVATIYTGEK